MGLFSIFDGLATLGLIGHAAPPHHEVQDFRREKGPHPEEPRSGVSKDGRKQAVQAGFEPYAIALHRRALSSACD
jgi:hypothetical protein